MTTLLPTKLAEGDPQKSQSSSPQTAVLAGAAAGGVAVVLMALLVTVTVFCMIKRRQKRKKPASTTDPSTTLHNPTYAGDSGPRSYLCAEVYSYQWYTQWCQAYREGSVSKGASPKLNVMH